MSKGTNAAQIAENKQLLSERGDLRVQVKKLEADLQKALDTILASADEYDEKETDSERRNRPADIGDVLRICLGTPRRA